MRNGIYYGFQVFCVVLLVRVDLFGIIVDYSKLTWSNEYQNYTSRWNWMKYVQRFNHQLVLDIMPCEPIGLGETDMWKH